MATESSGNSGIAFVVGGLVVLVLIIGAVLMFGGGNWMGGGQTKSVDVDINTPSLPSAPSAPIAPSSN
jgi:hypothetical protein